MIDIIYNTIQIIFWFIIILVPLVVIHELGHLIFARLAGVKVPEFGIGLPLTDHKITRKFKGINWSIYPWLFGGFVKIYGDHDEIDEHFEMAKIDPIKAKQSYIERRFAELVLGGNIEDILQDNFLEFDISWNWFSKIKFIEAELLEGENNDEKTSLYLSKIFQNSLKNLPLCPSFLKLDAENGKAIITNPSNYFKNLPKEKKDEINLLLKNEYLRCRSLLKTLVEWEFDSKISTYSKAIKNRPSLQSKIIGIVQGVAAKFLKMPTTSKPKEDPFFIKSLFSKVFIISGGVIFNFLAAIILFMVSFSILGTIPETYSVDRKPILNQQISQYKKDYKVDVLSRGVSVFLAQDSQLLKAGMENGDEIFQIGDRNIEENKLENLEDLANLLAPYENKNVDILYYRPKTNKTDKVTVVLQKDEKQNKVVLKAYLGYKVKKYSNNFFAILPNAVGETFKITGATFDGIGGIIKAILPNTEDRSALQSVAGPIGVGYVSGQIFDQAGLSGIIYLMAVVSIALAVFNILPIPALDGGRLVILIIGSITKKRFKQAETISISVTFFMLILVALLVAGLDIQRIISGK